MGKIENYINERWNDIEDVRTPMISAWQKFQALGIADREFEIEFTKGDEAQFYQRLWEINSGLHLSNLGYSISSAVIGLDFQLSIDDKTIWIEAVCPTPVGFTKEYLSTPSGTICSFPYE
ncbi:MAG: hypothetical protein JKX92_12550 [Porticoccaceae bacterium]|nr:hypothetical protein [Porticoccaceae bacterium]